jgi:DNA processing protein
VEAGTKSGALITASFAVDQGREVFAVPGSIMAPRSQGTNRLICQGARPLLKPVEVLEALNHTRIVEQQSARMVLPSDPVELQIYNLMSAEPVHIDEISDESHLSIDKVSATLAMMELKGMVRHVGGMRYMVIRDSALEYQVEKK